MSEAAFAEMSRAKRENYEKIYGAKEVNGEFSAEVAELFERLFEYELESMETEGTVTVFTNKPWHRPDKPTQGKTPRLPGEEIYIEEYETPLGVEVIINHVGDCFD